MAHTLLTGAAGMVGRHLRRRLGEADLLATDLAAAPATAPLDVRDPAALRDIIARHRPATIHHLAAQSLPMRAWADPAETMRVNVLGTVNLFEAILAARRAWPDYDPMVLVACSSAEYGASLSPDGPPVDEAAPLLPLNPYGVSKVAQDLLAFQYWHGAGIRSIRARLFNTTGPGKTDDVVSDFCRRAVAIERAGGTGTLRVGNLDARRAILDARDLADALVLLAARGKPGEAYNICADHAIRIGDLIPMLESLAGTRLIPRVDPALLRPTDEPVIIGRTDKLRAATGWAPRHALIETLRAVLDDARDTE